MVAQVPDHSAQSGATIQEQPTEVEAEVARLRRELAEALEQQTVTGEVLRVIASSPTDLQRVLDTIADSARHLCNAIGATITRLDGDVLRVTAISTGGEDRVMPTMGRTYPLTTTTPGGRSIIERRVVQVEDTTADETRAAFPDFVSFGARTLIIAPLVRDGAAIGTIGLGRPDARPFSPAEIALLQRFADQAVIAIENAHLFDELEQRNRDLAEALEHQTATAEVLRVIASSPTDLPGVLNTLTGTAARLCGAEHAVVQVPDGDVLRLVASVFTTEDEARHWADTTAKRRADGGSEPPVTLVPERIAGRAALERRTIYVANLADATASGFPASREIFEARGVRSQVTAPLIRGDALIGVFTLHSLRTDAFSPSQVAQLETFADQAVIAIENARLFQELQSRTAELAELNQTLEARVSEQVEQLERVGRLRRYLSPQLADMIVSSGDESILETHRRQITVVFCDLRGFTAFAEMAEPEEVMGVLNEYHAAMGASIRAYEGTFGRFTGDGLMIFFNDPLPQPDHVERAVRMACVMRERAAELARGWRQAGHELDFGVGIAVGYATLGRIGFEGRYDYDVIGTVANLAARLCAEAAGGQILIPARLLGMVEDLVETEPVGELTLKGLHRPVDAFNVTGVRDAGSLPGDQVTGQAATDI
jgi:class 3 adenylate cyclase/putative methionine-R-sulfoxide reductase with GAF domain